MEKERKKRTNKKNPSKSYLLEVREKPLSLVSYFILEKMCVNCLTLEHNI